jgi:hypothetical protein
MWWWRIGPRPHPDRAKHTAEATNHTKRNPDESERRSPQEPEQETGLAADQAGGAHPITSGDQLTTNNPASQRGTNFGTVWARPGRRQDWIFDGRGEGGPGDSRGLFLLGFLLTRS